MEVAIKTSFDAAHILGGYRGKCGNLHGHTYKVKVVVQGTPSIKTRGMVIDYNSLKPIVNSVIEQYDHAFIAGTTSEDEKLVEFFNQQGFKVKELYAPYSTTECIAMTIMEELYKALEGYSCNLQRVRVSETDSTWAEVDCL